MSTHRPFLDVARPDYVAPKLTSEEADAAVYAARDRRDAADATAKQVRDDAAFYRGDDVRREAEVAFRKAENLAWMEYRAAVFAAGRG